MPRTQALAIAIRTRRQSPTTRLPLASSYATLLSRHPLTSHPSRHLFPSVVALKPSPLRLAILRRHLTSLSSSSSRPQAPYLYASLYRDKSLRACINRFIRNRYLTTARKQRWRDTFRWQLRFHAYFWPMFLMLWMVYYGVQQIEMEHDFPTPIEWGFWARWEGRSGKCVLDRCEKRGWADVKEWMRGGEYLLGLISRLEDLKKEGIGLVEQEPEQQDEGGVLMVDGVGKVGWDIRAKKESWKQGYWECLMGLATISEHLDGLCRKKGSKLTEKEKLYKWENIPGPQNPRPVPPSWEKDGSHLNLPTFGDVEPAIDGPEVFYLKILTTKGFNTRQRLDAALAYADWCDFKGLKETTSHVYDWALDIATTGLPEGAQQVVDSHTGIITARKEAFVTENLLKVTTALGVWHARHGEVKQALPIFLSVLRARKSLPAAPPHMQTKASGKTANIERNTQTGPDVLMGYFSNLLSFFKESDRALVLPDGDEQPFHSLKEACEEVGIMTYIGEILFASSEQEREKGLSWTRDSVEAAEAILWFMDEQGDSQEQEGRSRCRQCLDTGLSNWQQMTRRMALLAKKKQEEAENSRGWFGLGLGTGSVIAKAIEEVQRWEEEEGQITLRQQKTASLTRPLKPTANPFATNSTID